MQTTFRVITSSILISGLGAQDQISSLENLLSEVRVIRDVLSQDEHPKIILEFFDQFQLMSDTRFNRIVDGPLAMILRFMQLLGGFAVLTQKLSHVIASIAQLIHCRDYELLVEVLN